QPSLRRSRRCAERPPTRCIVARLRTGWPGFCSLTVYVSRHNDVTFLPVHSEPHRLRALFAIVLLACSLPSRLSAVAERCAICGAAFAEKIYVFTDKVTNEKRHICQDCSLL